MRTSVYAGSFDPPTNGHLWMIQRGLELFDRLIVAIGSNPAKSYTFTVDERLTAMGCGGKFDEGMGCGKSREACLTHNLWEQLSAHVHVFLSKVTIADVIRDRLHPCPAVPDFSALLMDEEAHA